jgi:hypothetical protein
MKPGLSLTASHHDSDDEDEGDDVRKQAAHAHTMSHHALEMGEPGAHKAAADAHKKLAKMHTEKAHDLVDEDDDEDEDD